MTGEGQRALAEISARLLGTLVVDVFDVLVRDGEASAREIARSLGVMRTDVNTILYGNPGLFVKGGGSPPTWSLVPEPEPASVTPASDGEQTSVTPTRRTPPLAGSRADRPSSFPPLRRWQGEALESWRTADSSGVVEAVTGTGKTLVGLAAIAEQIAVGGKGLVLVPTKELLYQWHDAARSALRRTRVGLLGDGHKDDLKHKELVIAIVNSARTRSFSTPPGSVLVADECHRYASDENQRALDSGFSVRLGLTATYERDDGAHKRVLDPYFGSVVFRMGYQQAVAEEVTAHFKVALIGVPLTYWEQADYSALTKVISDSIYELERITGRKADPLAEFMRFVNRIADDPTHPLHRRVRVAAGRLNKALNERRSLLAGAQAKMLSLRGLADSVAEADRTLVFTQTIAAAEAVTAMLAACGLKASAAHSELKADERAELLKRFGAGELDALVAPRILDEGVDVPAADLGIIVSASRTRRQMIQRMGRVLRRKEDGRLARFAILFVENTIEDPRGGTHEEFLEEVTGPAEDVRLFPAGTPLAVILNYLNDFEMPAGQPPALMEGDPPAVAASRVATVEEYPGPFEAPPFMLSDEGAVEQLTARVESLSEERQNLWSSLQAAFNFATESERDEAMSAWGSAVRAVVYDEGEDDASISEMYDIVEVALESLDFDDRMEIWSAYLHAHDDLTDEELGAFIEAIPRLSTFSVESMVPFVERHRRLEDIDRAIAQPPT